MTINEMIKELQALAENGYGDAPVMNAEGDDIYCITESDERNNKLVTIYF